MYYDFHVVTVKDTDYAHRDKTRLKLAKGTIIEVSLLFPSGSIGLLYLQIFRGSHQLYPFNPGGYFQTSGETINFSDKYQLEDEPLEVIAETWNLDDIWSHGVHIRFNVQPFLPLVVKKEEPNKLKAALKRLGL